MWRVVPILESSPSRSDSAPPILPTTTQTQNLSNTTKRCARTLSLSPAFVRLTPHIPPWCPRSCADPTSGVLDPVLQTATLSSVSPRAFRGGRGTFAEPRGWPARSSGRGGSCLEPSFRARQTGAWSLRKPEPQTVLVARVCAPPHV